MTVAPEFPEQVLIASGADTFALSFSYTAPADVLVITGPNGSETAQQRGVHYTLSGQNVTFAGPYVPAPGWRVILQRAIVQSQPDSFGDTAAFKPSMAGRVFDRVVRMIQDVRAVSGRALQAAYAGGPYNGGGQRITSLGAGTLTSDAVNLGQVNGLVAALLPGRLVDYPVVQNRVAAQLAKFDVGVAGVNLLGYYTAGDGGAAFYVRVGSQPSHTGKFQDASGAWFELSTYEPTAQMFGARGDWNGTSGTLDTTPLQNLLNYASTKRVKARLPAGKYLTGSLTIPGGCLIEGDGWNDSVIIQNDAGTLYANSNSSSARLGPMTFRDIGIEGRVATLGFLEPVHLVHLNGVEDVLFDRVRIYGFRGDGIYLGSGINPGDVRHNRRVTIRDCLFDGVTKDNRQGLSVIDVDGLIVSGCTFQNITRSNMPGAIDFEPNPGSTFAILRNILIDGNRFENIGGNVGVIAFAIPSDVPMFRDVRIQNNLVIDCGNYMLALLGNRTPAATDPDADVLVSGNMLRGGGLGAPFQLAGVKGVTFRNNHYAEATAAGFIGQVYACRNIRVADIFDTVGMGSAAPYGVAATNVTYLDLSDSVFINCGGGQAGRAAIYFPSGTSSFVRINRITFTAGATVMDTSVRKNAGHTFSPGTNQFIGNQIGTGVNTNQFEAYESDLLWTAFTPTVYGSTAPGAGVYTAQQGRFRRLGRMAFVHADIVQTSHSGATGQARIRMPTELGAADTSVSAVVQPGHITAAGVSGDKCFLTPSATPHVGFTTFPAGVPAVVTVPAGAAEYVVNASYQLAA